MGNSGSTRRITVVNDDASGVIKISDSVVNRLRGELESQQTNKVRKTDSEFEPSAKPQRDESRPITPAKPVLPPKLPSTPPVDKPEAKAPRISKEEAKQLESYWREKYYENEAANAELHKKTVVEFNKSLDEVEALFGYRTNTCYLDCEDFEVKIIKCYQENAGKTLNCSHIVKDYVDCVDAMRSKAFVTKG
uniref:MICOS complex subunit Mic19 n=1 Tax=Scolopendra viridis TaxID=118503 RepID=A0A4D5R8Z2_SCOVI